MQYSSNKLSSNYELLNVGHCLRTNKLSLNVSKTNFIVFSNRDKTFNIPLKINERVIDRVGFTKFLGILIDEDLKFKHHVNSVCIKISKACGILYKFSYFLPDYIIRNIYIYICLLFIFILFMQYRLGVVVVKYSWTDCNTAK